MYHPLWWVPGWLAFGVVTSYYDYDADCRCLRSSSSTEYHIIDWYILVFVTASRRVLRTVNSRLVSRTYSIQ